MSPPPRLQGEPDEAPLEGLAPARFLPPMLASSGLEEAARAGGPLRGEPGAWLVEPKLDGLRCVAVRNGGEVHLWSRNRLSLDARFAELARSVLALPAADFVLDGEVVALARGRPDFASLQAGGEAEYWVFDLPWLLGRDTRHLPVEERKHLLGKLLGTAGPESRYIRVVKPLAGQPKELFQRACRDGWEGLVAKRAGSPYQGGRSRDWLKLKCGCRQELVVGGFTPPKGGRTGFGALLLGYWQGGRLLYAGKVGTGFTEAGLTQLFARLVALEKPTSSFATPVGEKGARWAEPQLVAEVAFSNWTPDGRLRHPSFVGLRLDKPSSEVVREECVPGPALDR